ncbi:MAG: extracellular solute-binding protein [Clostridiales bacterium]|nr:extracellular solute-binding protein [Clostridiales bacterium]
MKKNEVKIISFVLLFALVLTTLSGCGSKGSTPKISQGSQTTADTKKDPFGPLPEKTTMTVFKLEAEVPQNLNSGETQTNNLYVKEASKRLNIDYQFPIDMKGGPAASDKMNLMIASNDILDVMTVGYNQFLTMQKSDMLQDLTNAYNDYAAPAVKDCYKSDNGQALKQVTKDGKLYGLPTMGCLHNSDPEIWLRQDWLDKLKLKAPTTLDELMPILKAFIENDPDGDGKKDTVGLAGQESFANETAQTFSYDAIFDTYKSYVKTWLKDSNGSVVYGSITPETKTALSKLHDMYAQGLLPKDFAITKSDQANQLVASGKAGAFFGPWWSGWSPLTDSIKNNPKADWKAYVLKDVDGKYNAKQELPVSSVAVLKKGFKYPEALVKSINFYYQIQLDDPSLVGGDPYNGKNPMPDWGSMPVALGLWRADSVLRDHQGMEAYAAGTTPAVTPSKQNQKYYSDVAANWKKGLSYLKSNPDSFGDAFSRFVGVQPIEDAKTNPIYSVFYGQTPTMEKKKANLDKIETQAMLDIIVGDKSVDTFDSFVKQWKSMGGDEITKEVQDAIK